ILQKVVWCRFPTRRLSWETRRIACPSRSHKDKAEVRRQKAEVQTNRGCTRTLIAAPNRDQVFFGELMLALSGWTMHHRNTIGFGQIVALHSSTPRSVRPKSRDCQTRFPRPLCHLE